MREKERYAIEACLLDEIQSQVDLVLDLCEKYNLSTKLFEHVVTLLEQRRLIEMRCYTLEREYLNNNSELLVARFPDGTNLTARRLLRQKEII